ncbi:MAG: hypothetical protein H6581_02430 [Bacteroidia bacterium]|nr:hypothetical protein [Bacteroidia bacterium]
MKKTHLSLLILLCAVLLGPQSSFAADRYWVAAASSTWNDPNNWSLTQGGPAGASVPASSDAAIFDGSGPGDCLIDVPVAIAALTLNGYNGVIDLNTFPFVVTGAANNLFASGTIRELGSLSTLQINCSGTTTFQGTLFETLLDVTSANLYLNGSTFNLDATFTKTGPASNFGNGGNTFNAASTFTSTQGNLYLSHIFPDLFNGPVTLHSNSTGRIYAAHTAAGTQFNDDIYMIVDSAAGWLSFGWNNGSSLLAAGKSLQAGGTGSGLGEIAINYFTQTGPTPQNLTLAGGKLRFGTGCIWNGDVTGTAASIVLNGSVFNGAATFSKTGPAQDFSWGGNIFNGQTTLQASNGWLAMAQAYPDTFNGNLNLISLSGGRVQTSYNVSGTLFNGDIQLEIPNGNGWISFGENGGNSQLAAGKSFNVGGSGIITGEIRFNYFTQLGTGPQNLSLPQGVMRIGPGTVWNGDVTFSADRIFLNGGTFNGQADLTKTGSMHDVSLGGNTFNQVVNFNLLSAGTFAPASLAGNVFNDDVYYYATSLYMRPANGSPCYFRGDVVIVDAPGMTFGLNGGKMIVDGTSPQYLANSSGQTMPVFRHLHINNPSADITLHMPLTISDTLLLDKGKIINDTNFVVIFRDNAVALMTSDNSYVTGPVRKVGNDAFTFPVGDNGHYQPISMSAPVQTTDAFTATYFNVNPHPTYDKNSKVGSIHHLSSNEYWTLDRTAGTSAVNVTLSWGLFSGAITAPADLVVARWDGNMWQNHGNGGVTGNTTAGTVVTSAPVPSFSPFTLASLTSSNPLPVEFLSFSARAEGNRVALQWETRSELNCDHYLIERSGDESNWTSLGQVPSGQSPDGQKSYQYEDKEPFAGMGYYRIRQVDLNGEFSYSETRSVNMENFSGMVLNAFPNPTHNQITIEGEGLHANGFRFLNLAGQDLTSAVPFQQKTNGAWSADLSALPAGLYLLSTHSGFARIVKE